MLIEPAKILIPAQCAVAMIALTLLTMWPPQIGNMLLVPLIQSDANSLAKAALNGGALLLGEGPFPGSLVVIGNRSTIARRIRSWDVVIMAAPPAGCGAKTMSGVWS